MDYQIGDKIFLSPVEHRRAFQSKELIAYLEDYGKDIIFEVRGFSISKKQIDVVHNFNKFSFNPKNWEVTYSSYILPEELFTI